MNIIGLQKTTLLDYPGHVAATLFTGGCNFRCPFCHNSELVLNPGAQQELEEILTFLKKRQNILDGICITGGEPTLQEDLEEFIRKVRELGYLVKLDTNGYRPDVLKGLLEKGLLDYVAMDVKASRGNYAKAIGWTNTVFDIGKIEESITILKSCNIDYEFRTTVVKGIHTIEEFEEIGQWLCGAKAYYLQGYQESDRVLALNTPGNGNLGAISTEFSGTGLSVFSEEEMKQMADLAGKYIEKVLIRGQ